MKSYDANDFTVNAYTHSHTHTRSSCIATNGTDVCIRTLASSTVQWVNIIICLSAHASSTPKPMQRRWRRRRWRRGNIIADCSLMTNKNKSKILEYTYSESVASALGGDTPHTTLTHQRGRQSICVRFQHIFLDFFFQLNSLDESRFIKFDD